MIKNYVSAVRSFNRFYTVFMGILNKTYLNSKYSLPETRVLHATSTKPGITSTEIIDMLKIDKSYLSRMIDSLEKRKLLTRKKSKDDGRAFNLFLTSFGTKEFDKINDATNNQIENLLKNISESNCKKLIKNMAEIESILS